jgi:hypothetical protein
MFRIPMARQRVNKIRDPNLKHLLVKKSSSPFCSNPASGTAAEKENIGAENFCVEIQK